MNNNIIQSLTLELSKPVSHSSLAVKKYDTNTRLVQVTLTNSSSVLQLEDIAYAVIQAAKPDGGKIYNDCVISGNVIQFMITTQMINVPGDVECELQLTWKDESVLTTSAFTIHVYDTVQTGIESQNEYGGLLQAYAETISLRNEANESASKAAISEQAAKVSEDNAKASELTASNAAENAAASEANAATAAETSSASSVAAGISEANAADYKASTELLKNAAEQSAGSALASEAACAGYATNLENAVSSSEESADAALSSKNAAKVSEDNAKASELAAQEYLNQFGEGQLILGETETTAYRGDRGKVAYDHAGITGNPHGASYADVGADPSGASAEALLQAKNYSDLELDLIVGELESLSTTNKNDIVSAINEAVATAKGRCTGYVFDTYNDLVIWIAVPSNTVDLNLGDNFYLRQTDVPDYWWDGATIQQLETQKVDLSEIESSIASLMTRVSALEDSKSYPA